MFSYIDLAEYKECSCLNQHQTTHSSSTTAWRSKTQQGAVSKILLKEVTNEVKLALKSERATELCPPPSSVILWWHQSCGPDALGCPDAGEDLWFHGVPRCGGEPRFGRVLDSQSNKSKRQKPVPCSAGKNLADRQQVETKLGAAPFQLSHDRVLW